MRYPIEHRAGRVTRWLGGAGKKRQMRKVVILLMTLLMGRAAQGQNIYVSRDAEISFYSSAPIEDIEAKTNKAVSAINPETGAIFVKVPVQSFQFEQSLMQEHFNSDYLESDKFPFAVFNGKITGLPQMLKDGTFPVTVAGQLTIHGVTKPYQGPGTVVVKGGQLVAASTFKVHLADHQIKIPSILTKDIAEVVDIRVNASYQQQAEAGNKP